jgi:hypothetical protein
VNEATTLNQRTLEAFTLPSPKAPDRWLFHDQFRPRPIEFTAEGEVEGGLSWLIGSTIDLRFTRALFAPSYSKEGGHGYDPASSFFLEVASRVDGYPDSARFCADGLAEDITALTPAAYQTGGLPVALLLSDGYLGTLSKVG